MIQVMHKGEIRFATDATQEGLLTAHAFATAYAMALAARNIDGKVTVIQSLVTIDIETLHLVAQEELDAIKAQLDAQEHVETHSQELEHVT